MTWGRTPGEHPTPPMQQKRKTRDDDAREELARELYAAAKDLSREVEQIDVALQNEAGPVSIDAAREQLDLVGQLLDVVDEAA